MAVCKKTFSTDNNLSFKNATSLIKFSLARTDVKYVTFTAADSTKIHGNGKLCFTFDESDVPSAAFDENEGGSTIRVNTDGAGTFYIATLPCMINGFSIKFYDSDEVLLGEAKTDKTLILGPNKIVTLSGGSSKDIIDPIIVPPDKKDLSVLEPANCYIVSEAGLYTFKAVKGNSTESVGDVKGVKVLWESFGTDVTPTVGDLIKTDVSYKDGYIIFSTNDTFKEGNAVIAAYSDSGCTDGNVLWSWHIWMTDKPEDQVYINNAGTMMDRNLGATSATPGDVKALGLLYQWGRKDPFMGGYQIYYDSCEDQQQAAATIAWPEAVTSNETNGTIPYAVAHPMTFITFNFYNLDWYYSGSDSSTDNTRWQASDKAKGLYDPCPVGYRVPDGGPSGVWSTAFDTTYYLYSSSSFDSVNRGMNFGATDKTLGSGTIWYPAAGYRCGDDGSLFYVGDYGQYWSCTPNRIYAWNFDFICEGYVDPSSDFTRGDGQSVRCVKE